MTDRFMGRHQIQHPDSASPYMTRYWFGRLRLHIFYRGDLDADPHDHPWDFWTFPLTPYVEEVILPHRYKGGEDYERHRQVVPAWRWHYRPAIHTHRVLGRYADTTPYDPEWPHIKAGKIITIVWRGSESRKWGFLKNRDGKWCWEPWRKYVYGGGKHAPCEPEDVQDQ